MKQEMVWCVEKLDAVVRHWIDGYKPTDGKVVTHADWWLDHAKGQVVVCLFTQEEK